MANNYYSYTDTFTPGLKARSGDMDREYQAIQTAFDFLPASTDALPTGKATFAGTSAGAGNLYELTMPNTRTSNTNGDGAIFIADKTNTGAATIMIDAIAAVPLTNWNGTALAGGEIVAGQFYSVRYDTTNIRFVIEASTDAALNKSYAEEWANAAINTLVSAAAGGNLSDDYSARHQAAGAKEWSQRAEDDLVPAEFGGNLVDEYSAFHWAQKAAGVSGLPITSTDGATLRSNGTGWEEFTDVLLGTSGSVFLEEKAAAESSVAGRGQLWIRNDSPNVLVYTDDDGTDAVLGEVNLETPVNIIGDTDGVAPLTQTSLLQWVDADESNTFMSMGFTASADFRINLTNGSNANLILRHNGSDRIEMQGGGRTVIGPGNSTNNDVYINAGANGTNRAIQCLGSGEVYLYQSDILVANTQTAANGGMFVNNTFSGSGNERVLTDSDIERGKPFTAYAFSTNTSATTPSSGDFKGNNSVAASVTELYFDDLNNSLQNAENHFCSRVAAGDLLTMHEEGLSNNNTVFRVTGAATDNTGWWTIPVEHVFGTWPFGNTDIIYIQPQWLSEITVSIPGTTTGSHLRYDGADYIEDTSIRSIADGDLSIYATDDATSTASAVQWRTNSGDLRAQIGPGVQNSNLVIENLQLGHDVILQSRNTADTATRVGFDMDPDAVTQVIGVTDARLVGGINVTGVSASATTVTLNYAGTEVLETHPLADGGVHVHNDYNGDDGARFERVWTESQQDWISATAMYQFESSTTAGDPGEGDLRFNNATPSLVTNIYVDDLAEHGNHDMDWLWTSLSDGDVIIIRSNNDMADYWMGTVNGTPTDNTGWWTIPVTHLQSGTLFTNDDLINVSVQYTSSAPVRDNITGGGTTVTASASEVTIAGMDETDDGLVLQDGARVTFEDQAFANDAYLRNEGLGGGSGTLTLRFDSTGNFIVHGGIQTNNGTDGALLTAFSSPTRLNVGDSMRVQGGLYLVEQSSADTDVSGDGQIWVRNYTVNQPWYTDDAGVDRPFAFAVTRRVATNAAWNMNTGNNDYNSINGLAYYDDGSAYTITSEDSGSTNWPVDCSFQILARGGGTITISEGSGVTMYTDDGTGFADSTGSSTLVDGAATLYRASATVTLLWGSGLTI